MFPTVKKLISVILSVIMVLACFPAVYSGAAVTRYVITGEKADVYANADNTSSKLGTVPKGTYIDVSGTKNGYLLTKINSTNITGWIFAGDASVIKSSSDIESIKITTMPTKTIYDEGKDTFDPSGMVVTATLSDGQTKQITGYTIFTESFETSGTKTVTVLYKEPNTDVIFTDSLTVTVKRFPVKSITVEKNPDRTEYIENLPLDLSGMTIRLSYTDGTPDTVLNGNEITAESNIYIKIDDSTDTEHLTVGTHTVYVYYRYDDIFCSFDISVRQRQLSTLTVLTQPDSTTVYTDTVTPVLTGLTLEAVYDNGDTKTVTADECTVTCDLTKFRYGSGNIVTASFEGKSVDIDFTYKPLTETRIRVQTPQQLFFTLGEVIDLSVVRVFLVFSDGSEQEISDYTMSEIDKRNTNPQTVVVTYKNYAETFTIYIDPSYRRGDVNGDGNVTVTDARLVLRQAVKLISLTANSNPLRAADVDRNGTVNVADARLALRAAVKLEDLLDSAP